MIRIIIAALVGGLVMFCWGAFSHMVLPFAEAGVTSVPNEAAVTSALQSNIKDPGFYFLPGMVGGHNATEEVKAAWAAKYATGPTAILIYHPDGETAMSPKQLGTEFLSNTLGALFVALIMSFSGAGFIRRVEIATLVGAAGWASISLSQWNWYRFPTPVILAEGFDQIVGWLITGIAMSFFIKRREP
ncbi:MAG: hypothetical protein ABI646_03685 [Acidobacteriota bacterium]